MPRLPRFFVKASRSIPSGGNNREVIFAASDDYNSFQEVCRKPRRNSVKTKDNGTELYTGGILRPFERLAMEPPIRMFVYALFWLIKPSVERRAAWGISPRPAYLIGTLTAAKMAKRENVNSISVIEFGVAGGKGLLALQEEAEAVEKETGVEIKVYGFDAGAVGQPEGTGDYRDLPDMWQTGDFPMDETALRARLTDRTTLIIGNVSETVETFFSQYNPPPLGFLAFDMELYSGTRDALKIMTLPNKKMLRHIPLYFEDISNIFNHQFAGAPLAIEEFNRDVNDVKINRWNEVEWRHAFPERRFLKHFYVAHNLPAISRAKLGRDSPLQLPM